MSRKKKKAAAAAKKKVEPKSSPPAESKLRVLLPSGRHLENPFSNPFSGNFSQALWRGSARFSRTLLSFSYAMLLNSSRVCLNLARNTPQWLRQQWARRNLEPPKPTPPSQPKDHSGTSVSSLTQHLKVAEDLQRSVHLLMQQKIKDGRVHLDQHIQRTEGSVSLSIRNISMVQIGSSGQSSTATPSSTDPLTAGPSTAGPSTTSSPDADPSAPADGQKEDQVLAHMDLMMTRLPVPANAMETSKGRNKIIDRSRKALRTEVLRSYQAQNAKGQVWCCIRREWRPARDVCTAHLAAVSIGDNYLQYVFNDAGPHLWNPENAIPISVDLEDALDAGQIAIVPAQPDDVDFSPDPHNSVPRDNRFKMVVFDDTFTTYDGEFTAEDLHGRLLGFQDPDFRPGLRYVCFNVVTTLARRQRYKVLGAEGDLDKLGDSRFLLAPGKFIHDTWLLKTCAQLGIDLDQQAQPPQKTGDEKIDAAPAYGGFEEYI
ncbi:hypothetical protein IWZ03DRAFT_379141 [Phyllosticta citriasiana]|uniref:HNH nuclease domain-containing protein n=1 Tax=Phyllosticta citriasiana TaxID=595635 RepID=A0ABR1KL56_9PEZI